MQCYIKVENQILYENKNNIHELAAMYVFAPATGHPFNDGNKRTAMVSMMVFLSLNNVTFNAPDQNLADTIVKIADNQMDLQEIVKWIKLHNS